MTVELKLIGARYNIITLIFFIPYVLFQPPATVVLRKVGPRVFLSAITIFWGATMIVKYLQILEVSRLTCIQGFGFAPTWDVLVGLRIILGVLEAGFFPGCAYLLSCWCKRSTSLCATLNPASDLRCSTDPRYQLQKRNAVFYLIGSMASALSGILAYGVMQMKGLGGLSGWRWIFIVS